MKRVRGFLWRAAVLGLVLAWAFSGGPLLAVGAWVVFAYLVWRAAPAVSVDIVRALSLVKGHGRLAGQKGRARL